jgi:ankyrin repeat protein
MDLSRSIEEMISSFKSRRDYSETIFKKWINAPSNQGYTAILFASYRGNIDTIKILIENGADIYSTNIQGLNVVHMASQGNQPSSIVYFKEKFNFDLMSLDGVGSTALHWACYTGSEDAFNFLLSYNVNINSQDNEGLTPLHLAIISGIIRIINQR